MYAETVLNSIIYAYYIDKIKSKLNKYEQQFRSI